MDRRFDRCLTFLLKEEGGYVDHPADPGGATNLGITLGTLQEWRGRTVTKDEVRRLTRTEAAAIYRARYWLAAHCDLMPAGIDLLLFDTAVNMGVDPALNLLASRLGVATIIGRHRRTRVLAHDRMVNASHEAAALAHACVPGVICGFAAARLARYRRLKTWETFGRGWAARVTRVQNAAMRMWGHGAMFPTS